MAGHTDDAQDGLRVDHHFENADQQNQSAKLGMWLFLATEILFFGETLDAPKLLDLGLVNKILPHGELIPYAKKIASKLVPPRGASLAVGLTKQALHGPLIEAVSRALDVENEGLNKAFASADFWEALAARKEKRDPEFKGA